MQVKKLNPFNYLSSPKCCPLLRKQKDLIVKAAIVYSISGCFYLIFIKTPWLIVIHSLVLGILCSNTSTVISVNFPSPMSPGFLTTHHTTNPQPDSVIGSLIFIVWFVIPDFIFVWICNYAIPLWHWCNNGPSSMSLIGSHQHLHITFLNFFLSLSFSL